jgi:hypothetical protein
MNQRDLAVLLFLAALAASGVILRLLGPFPPCEDCVVILLLR